MVTRGKHNEPRVVVQHPQALEVDHCGHVVQEVVLLAVLVPNVEPVVVYFDRRVKCVVDPPVEQVHLEEEVESVLFKCNHLLTPSFGLLSLLLSPVAVPISLFVVRARASTISGPFGLSLVHTTFIIPIKRIERVPKRVVFLPDVYFGPVTGDADLTEEESVECQQQCRQEAGSGEHLPGHVVEIKHLLKL